MCRVGWLGPDGIFFECHNGDHVAVADYIVERYGYPHSLPNAVDVDDVLLNKGWVHITVSSFFSHEWHIYWNKPLTEYQKNFLKPYFEDGEIPVSEAAKACWEMEELR